MMLLSQSIFCTVGIMASVVTCYRLDFYDFDGPPSHGCESDQLVWRDTWHSDASAQCTSFKVSDQAKYVRVTKTDESDNEHDILFSRSDDCGDIDAVRIQEGCFDISKTFPDIKSYQIVSHSIGKATGSRCASNVDAWSPTWIWVTTAAGVTAVNAIRSNHGDQIAAGLAIIGRPLWEFVNSRFISTILIAQVFATGAVYLKQQWLPGNENQSQCEETESKVDRLTKIIKKVAPVEQIESIKAMVTFKDGSTMTITHPAVEEEVRKATKP